MTEEQPNDVSNARAAAVPHAPARELPLQQWEGEGGAMPTGASRASGSTVATTKVGSVTAQHSAQPRCDEVDPDAITERHFFAENEGQLRR